MLALFAIAAIAQTAPVHIVGNCVIGFVQTARPQYPSDACVPEDVSCRVQVDIAADGSVTGADVTQCPEAFAEASRRAMWRWRFAVDGSCPEPVRYHMVHKYMSPDRCFESATMVIRADGTAEQVVRHVSIEPYDEFLDADQAAVPRVDPTTVRWTRYEAPIGPSADAHDYPVFGGECLVDVILPAGSAAGTVKSVACDAVLRTAVEQAASTWAFEPAPAARRVLLEWDFEPGAAAAPYPPHPAIPR